MTAPDLTVAERLGIAPGSLVWLTGDSVEETSLLDPLPEGVETYEDSLDDEGSSWQNDTWTVSREPNEEPEPTRPVGVDTAVMAVSNPQEFHALLDDMLPRVGSVTSVWVVHPGAAIDRTIIERGIGDYGWRIAETVLLDDTWTGLRLRQV